MLAVSWIEPYFSLNEQIPPICGEGLTPAISFVKLLIERLCEYRPQFLSACAAPRKSLRTGRPIHFFSSMNRANQYSSRFEHHTASMGRLGSTSGFDRGETFGSYPNRAGTEGTLREIGGSKSFVYLRSILMKG
jgi:hypothetical protein